MLAAGSAQDKTKLPAAAPRGRDLLEWPHGGVVHAGVGSTERLDPAVFFFPCLVLLENKTQKHKQETSETASPITCLCSRPWRPSFLFTLHHMVVTWQIGDRWYFSALWIRRPVAVLTSKCFQVDTIRLLCSLILVKRLQLCFPPFCRRMTTFKKVFTR